MTAASSFTDNDLFIKSMLKLQQFKNDETSLQELFPIKPFSKSEYALLDSCLKKTLNGRLCQVAKALCDQFLQGTRGVALRIIHLVIDILRLSYTTLESERSFFSPSTSLQLQLVQNLDDPVVKLNAFSDHRVRFSQTLFNFFRSLSRHCFDKWEVKIKEAQTIPPTAFFQKNANQIQLMKDLERAHKYHLRSYYANILKEAGFLHATPILKLSDSPHILLPQTVSKYLYLISSAAPHVDDVGYEVRNNAIFQALGFKSTSNSSLITLFNQKNDELHHRLDFCQWLLLRFQLIFARFPTPKWILDIPEDTIGIYNQFEDKEIYPQEHIPVFKAGSTETFISGLATLQQYRSSDDEANFWFHGTQSKQLHDILRNGIEPSRGNAGCDFGSAYYLGIDYKAAVDWAKRALDLGDAAVLIYRISSANEEEFNQLAHYQFPSPLDYPSKDFTNWQHLIIHCRREIPIRRFGEAFIPKKVQWIEGPEANVNDAKAKLLGDGWKPIPIESNSETEPIQRAIIREKAANLMNKCLCGITYYSNTKVKPPKAPRLRKSKSRMLSSNAESSNPSSSSSSTSPTPSPLESKSLTPKKKSKPSKKSRSKKHIKEN
ncbi:MAG: hypothetical protein Q8P67_12975 [archaeon]|nr:hypothetical protein [archaeon]